MTHRDGHPTRTAGRESWVTRPIGARRFGLLAGVLALLALAAAGCGAAVPARMAPPADPEATGGAGDVATAQATQPGDGTWVLESLDGRPAIEDSFIVLTVSEDLATGFDGCNRYGGRSADGRPVFDISGKFSAPPVGGTDIGCPEPEGVLDQAEAYLRALMRGRTFSVSGERLEILDAGGEANLVFVRQAPLPGEPVDLQGTGWRLRGHGDAGAATMNFLDDRLVTGVTACRAFLSTYRGTGGSVRFPSTSMLEPTHSCPEEARRLEGEFTDFLTWATEYAVSGEEGSRILRMRSSRGRTLTFEPLPPTIRDIADTEWTLVAFVELRDEGSGTWNARTSRVIQGTDVTISFGEDGLSGSAGCNSYSGRATAEGGVITIDARSLSHTERYCGEPDGLMDQEERFLDLVPRMVRYGTYGDGLFLHADDDVFLLLSAR